MKLCENMIWHSWGHGLWGLGIAITFDRDWTTDEPVIFFSGFADREPRWTITRGAGLEIILPWFALIFSISKKGVEELEVADE